MTEARVLTAEERIKQGREDFSVYATDKTRIAIYARLDALRQEHEALKGAAQKLLAECHELTVEAVRVFLGVTNAAVFKLRVDEAAALALAGPPAARPASQGAAEPVDTCACGHSGWIHRAEPSGTWGPCLTSRGCDCQAFAALARGRAPQPSGPDAT